MAEIKAKAAIVTVEAAPSTTNVARTSTAAPQFYADNDSDYKAPGSESAPISTAATLTITTAAAANLSTRTQKSSEKITKAKKEGSGDSEAHAESRTSRSSDWTRASKNRSRQSQFSTISGRA